MVLEEKTPDLLALLTAHARGTSFEVLVVARPPTLASTRASSGDVTDKKQKRDQKGKGFKRAEEGEISHSSQQPPTKEPQTIRAQ